MRKAKAKNDGSREYRPSLTDQVGMWALAGFFFLLIVLYVKIQNSWYGLACMIPLFGLFIWVNVIQATQMSLTLREDGLERHFGSSMIFSSWHNLSEFTIQSSGRNSITGISLKSLVKQEVSGGKVERKIFGTDLQNFIRLCDVVRVPVLYDKKAKKQRVDIEKFVLTPFGKDLMQYAPHLFEQEGDTY